MKISTFIPISLLAISSFAVAEDFGKGLEASLAAKSKILFGVDATLAESAPKSVEEGFRTPDAKSEQLLSLAKGLKAEIVTRDIANHADMIAFYPLKNPTHMIVCIEGDREELVGGKLNPGVQRVAMADGKVETIVRGTASCDGIRTTPWNTVLFTEEADDGGAYEILNPLAASDVVITDRAKGETTDSIQLRKHLALPIMAWEGLTVLRSGTVYAGDELRPGTSYPNTDGGAMFKFIPARPMQAAAIASLDDSPLNAGRLYAMQVSCQPTAQFGQGCEIGDASWVPVNANSARVSADVAGATGYYRPEDLHEDVTYNGEGVKFCWTNTGNSKAGNFGEVLCAIDKLPDVADGKMNTRVWRFIAGNKNMNQPDNLEINPKTGLIYVVEDNPNGDIWACLPDGADVDDMTDGCVRVLSVADSSAEPTGFIFAPDGETAYLNIQHSNDAAMAKFDGYNTDDLIKITGFGPVELALR
jgi:secreted PhoX family phosphatase